MSFLEDATKYALFAQEQLLSRTLESLLCSNKQWQLSLSNKYAVKSLRKFPYKKEYGAFLGERADSN